MQGKSLQVTRLCLVTWKDFSGICDLQKTILALPTRSIVSFPVIPKQTSQLMILKIHYKNTKKEYKNMEIFVKVIKLHDPK